MSFNQSGLRDNHTRGSVAEFLEAKIQTESKLSVVSAYFTIYAYDALRSYLDTIGHLDFLFGEPSFVNRLDPDKTEKKSFIIDAEGLELANKLRQKRVAKECADWIERKVDIKTIKQSNLLHGKMYHVAAGGVEDAIIGSSNFTVRGLGLGDRDNNIELNLIVDSNRDRAELKQWFTEVWNDESLVKDVKQDVLVYLRMLYSNQSPQFIYYLTLFHLFRDFLDGTRDLDEILKRVALPDTRIWRTLFSFQKDGAKAAINKILDYNGCILADSVGLGKTYSACMGLCLSRRHQPISVVLCHSILLFDLRRKHSLVPTAYLHRRRAQRRSRTALLQRRRRLVLDGREHGGRLLAIGWLARAMIRGEPAIGRDQSREPRLYSVEPVSGADHEAVIRFCGQGSEAAGPFSQRHCSHSRMRIAATSDRHRLPGASSAVRCRTLFVLSRYGVLLTPPAAARHRPAPHRS